MRVITASLQPTWVPGAERCAQRLASLPGVALVQQGPNLGRDVPATPRCILVRDGVAVKYRAPDGEIQLLTACPLPGVDRQRLAAAIDAALDAPVKPEDDPMDETDGVYGDPQCWLPGSLELAQELKRRIPEISSIEQGKTSNAAGLDDRSEPKCNVVDGAVWVGFFHDGRQQSLRLVPKLRANPGSIRSAAVKVIGEHWRQRTTPAPTPSGVDRRRIATDYGPIPGAFELAEQLLTEPGIDYVRIHRFDERHDNLAPRPPRAKVNGSHIDVTLFSGIQQQILLVFPKHGLTLEETLSRIEQTLQEGGPTVTKPNPPGKGAPAGSKPDPRTIVLTPQQAETYEFVLTLGPKSKDEFPVEAITTKLTKKFGRPAGTNRYMALVGRKLIFHRGDDIWVKRVAYTTGRPQARAAPVKPPARPQPTSSPKRGRRANPVHGTIEDHYQFFVAHPRLLALAAQIIDDAPDGDVVLLLEAVEHLGDARRRSWTIAERDSKIVLFQE